MTICHITSMHEFNDDRIFERAARGLRSLDNRVLLIAPYEGNAEIEGIEIIGLKKRNGVSRRILSSFEAYRKARKINADIFHFHDPDLMPWMVFLSMSGKNVVYDVHENYESRLYKIPLPAFLKNLSAKIYRKLENLFGRSYSGLTVVTESMKNLFKNVKKPIAITGNVVYLDRLKNISLNTGKESKFTIYTSGTNSPSRNCIKTIEALPIILKEVPDVQLKFVGRYYPKDYNNKLKEKAEELAVGKNVIIEGLIPWEENFIRTARAHIGCVFYEDNLNNRITLPNRLFEYMFCGVAVLGEDFPEVKKVLKEAGAGLTVNSSDPNSIAENAIYMLKNPEIMTEMGRKGRVAVLEKYNFENSLNELMNFYNKILKAA